jgi:hypothetical protein
VLDHPLQTTAKQAIDDFVAQSLVFLLPGRKPKVPAWVASGTAFRSANGRVVVLTAKHNVLDAAAGEPLRLGYYRCDNALEDVAAGIALHPEGEIDVAAVALKAEATRTLQALALDPSTAIDASDDAAEDPLVLAGFPSVLTQVAEHERSGRGPLRSIWFKSVTYGTVLQDPPKDGQGRLRVVWSERELANGTSAPMPDPKGISGGGLWRFRNPAETELWSPPTAGAIIGVPVAFSAPTETEFAQSSSQWRSWFLATLELIDRDLPLS